MLEASTRLGPYEIVAPLGAGGMGEVYRARDTRLGREVAVKILPEHFANDPERQARFDREVRAVAALSHPSILAIHDYGTHGAITYAVMELLEGETLRKRLSQGPLPWREAVGIGVAIAEGLAAAHTKGVIHRDLKPENLFLTADGRVKILDFGLARIDVCPDAQAETGPYDPAATEPGRVMGTAGYMAPEQVRGQTTDARSDIFGFGCVLYEMLTGRRAFQRETAAETMTAILRDEPPEPAASGNSVPTELSRIIRQCLAKSPSQRLQSARDLALGLQATASDPALQRWPPARSFSWRLAGAVATALLIGGLGAGVYRLTRSGNHASAGKSVVEGKVLEALAVLPFVNAGQDPNQEYLSDGVTEGIIDNLSRMRKKQLRVTSFNVVSRYKGQTLDARRIGDELKVRALLTGRVAQQGATLTISVELVEVSDGSRIWGKRCSTKFTDLQTVQEEITRELVENLGFELSSEEERRLAKRPTEKPEAFRSYQLGLFYWNKRTEAGVNEAIKHFRQAIEKDPGYALAYSGLAGAYITLGFYGYVAPKQAAPNAKEAAQMALKLDETLAYPRAALAMLKFGFDWDWVGADTEFRRAIAWSPSDAIARYWYGIFLQQSGKLKEAKSQFDQALALEPASLIINAVAGHAYYYAGQYEQAVEQCQKTLALDPHFSEAHRFLGLVYQKQGKFRDAIAEFQSAIRFRGAPICRAHLGQAYALAGNRDEAQTLLEELISSRKDKYVSAYSAALIYAALGDKLKTFEWLDKAYEEQDNYLTELKMEPEWESLRSDPRFLKMLQRMGVADKTAGQAQDIQSVAVLPFQNVGGDPTTEFLSDGVADQIINSLSQVRRHDLKVRPFTSVSRYRGKTPEILAFGRELNVEMMVTGTLHQKGEELAIRVDLVDARADNHLWGRMYQGKVSEILDLQDQIARDVAANLQLRLTGEEEQRLTKRHTSDTEAYLLYRKGRHAWTIRTEERLKQSVGYYNQAIEKDPDYALAYAGLADSYSSLGYWGGLAPKVAFPRAMEAVQRALAIDKSLAEAHTSLGYIKLHYDWDWPAAETAFKRAIEADPKHASAYHWYSHCLIVMGRAEESLAASKRALEFDPLERNITLHLAHHYYYFRDYDRAIAHLRGVLDLESRFYFAHSFLAMALMARAGRAASDGQESSYAEAIAAAQAGALDGQERPAMVAILGYAYGMSGNKGEARKVLAQLIELSKRRYVSPYDLAVVHMGLGDKEQALRELRRSYEERAPHLVLLKAEPIFDSLRSDPRFHQLLKDMRLEP
jgi:serine/threonine-protein kinase